MNSKSKRRAILLILGVLVLLMWGVVAWVLTRSHAATAPSVVATATPIATSTATTTALSPTPTATQRPPSPTPPPPTATATPWPTATPTPAFRGHPEAFAPLASAEQARIARPADATPERPLLFEDRLLVGLYGTPGGPGLGILGTTSPTKTLEMTQDIIAEYQALLTQTQVISYFHMVTTIADGFPGKDQNYNHRVISTTLQPWIDVAHNYGAWSVLDIQPGHSPITVELAYVEPYLRQRDVHLAIDPEFMMSQTTYIPGQRIGFMSGETLNLVQAWLNELAMASGQRKMLIIHQFDNRMFGGKGVIVDYPMVDLVWDADGFGGPGPKIKDYEQYANEAGFEYGGFKIFYNYDAPVMTAAQVLNLEPKPVLVIYQ